MAKINKKFSFRGSEFAYKVKGKGRAIVFLHGFLGSKEIWDDYLTRLAKNFKVISLDLPGHGESQNLGYIHEMELIAKLIHSLLQQLKIRKVILVGHSLGGYVALAFAEQFPDSLLGLILVNSTAKGDTKSKVASRNRLIKLLKKDSIKPIALLVPSFFNFKTRNTAYQKRRYLHMAMKANNSGVIATIEGMKIRKEREIVLKFAPFPFLYLIGVHDQLLPSNGLIEEANLNKNGIFDLFENSSHMIFWEEKEKCFKQIKNFSKKLVSKR